MGFIKAPRDKKAVKPAATPATAATPAPAAGRLARTKTSETSPVTAAAAPEPINPNAWWVSDVTFIVEGRQVQAHKGKQRRNTRSGGRAEKTRDGEKRRKKRGAGKGHGVGCLFFSVGRFPALPCALIRPCPLLSALVRPCPPLSALIRAVPRASNIFPALPPSLLLLASRSDHFNFLFSSQPASQYVITEVSHDAFGLFIRWAYAGSRDVPASGALDLLKCAVAFNVPDLREVCETALTVLAAPTPVVAAVTAPAPAPSADADVAFNTWSDDPILARSSAGATPAPSSPIDLSMTHDFHSMLSDSMAMDIQV